MKFYLEQVAFIAVARCHTAFKNAPLGYLETMFHILKEEEKKDDIEMLIDIEYLNARFYVTEDGLHDRGHAEATAMIAMDIILK